MLNHVWRVAGLHLIAASTTLLVGCTIPPANLTASLGGGSAGARGTVRVLFINNTPYQAVFTYGTFDQTDQFSRPDFRQFGLADSDPHLNADDESSIDPVNGQSPLTCARVFGIGSANLLELIDENLPTATLIEESLVEGVEFFAPAPDAGEPVSMGLAPPFEALLGVDFPCESLLIVRFEVNDAGPDPFRIDFELIPASSTR